VQALNRKKRELLERGDSPETVRLLDQEILAQMQRLNERLQAVHAP
jgi:hypothetical protein